MEKVIGKVATHELNWKMRKVSDVILLQHLLVKIMVMDTICNSL